MTPDLLHLESSTTGLEMQVKQNHLFLLNYACILFFSGCYQVNDVLSSLEVLVHVDSVKNPELFKG